MRRPTVERVFSSGARTTCLTCVPLALAFLVAGCDSLRLAPSEQQEQNAGWYNGTAPAAVEATNQILGESDRQPATPVTESAQRPDPWRVTDSVLELGIGLGGLLGGVCGTRAVRFLRDARAKSKALKEIVAGNELFKKQQPS